MAMDSVSSVGGNSYYLNQTAQSQRASDFKALEQALNSGDLAGAQKAYSTIQQNAPDKSGNNPFSTDFNAVGQALSSGDLGTAQSAFAKLQQDMQQSGGVKSHHHHHNSQGSQSSGIASSFNDLAQALGSGDLSAAQKAYTTIQQNAPDKNGNGNGPFSTDFSAIGQALSSGDLNSAQSAFAKMQQDMQAGKSSQPYAQGVSFNLNMSITS